MVESQNQGPQPAGMASKSSVHSKNGWSNTLMLVSRQEQITRNFRIWIITRPGKDLISLQVLRHREPSIKSPGSASPELSINSNPRANIEAVVSNRSSVGRRVFRTVVGGFLIAVVVAVVWQAYRDDPDQGTDQK